jgi:hypothetical protein
MVKVIPHDLVLQVSARLKPKPEVATCTFNTTRQGLYDGPSDTSRFGLTGVCPSKAQT